MDGPLQVLVRPQVLRGEGLLRVGGELVWIRDGRAWTEEAAADAATAVLVARSWLREPSADDAEGSGLEGAMDDVAIEASAGLETTVNDPFVVRRGAHVAGTFRPWRWTGVTVEGGAYPSLGESDWTAATHVLVETMGVAPDLSRILGQGLVLGEVTPISGGTGDVGWALRLAIGGGLVATEDDLALIGQAGRPQTEAHRSEVHPQWAWSVASDATFGRWGLRARVAQTRYTEHVGVVDERKHVLWVGVDGLVSFEL